MLFFKSRPALAMADQKLPDYGVSYFDHLAAELDNLLRNLTPDRDEYAKKDMYKEKADELKAMRKNAEPLSWNDLYSIELLISNVLPLSRLPRQVWQLRSRYRDVVGLAQYEAYLASKPPDLTPDEVDANEYKADIEYLITEIYVRYLTTPYNEKLRNRISGKVTVVILCGISIVVICALLFNFLNTDSLGQINLMLVLFIGAMGGLLSMQQRYQSTPRDGDPVDNILLLQQGWSRLFMPAISGAVFAVLLYMIIIGGLVTGKLFPDISMPDDTNILNAIRHSSPARVADYAKLVVWSFLAGFAERFVPDTLSRFTTTRESGGKAGK